MKIDFLFFIVMIFVMASCSGSIPEPTPEQIEWAGRRWENISSDTLLRGRSLYISNCSGCHSLFTPETYSSEQWLEVLPEMIEKTKLQSDESELVKKYLLTVSRKERVSAVHTYIKADSPN